MPVERMREPVPCGIHLPVLFPLRLHLQRVLPNRHVSDLSSWYAQPNLSIGRANIARTHYIYDESKNKTLKLVD